MGNAEHSRSIPMGIDDFDDLVAALMPVVFPAGRLSGNLQGEGSGSADDAGSAPSTPSRQNLQVLVQQLLNRRDWL